MCPDQSLQVLCSGIGLHTRYFKARAGLSYHTYVHTDEKKKVYITESFLGFTAVKDTTGNGLTDTLTGVLDSLGLELTNCRGQSYDNGTNEGHTQGCPSFNTTEMSRGSVHPLL